jgi:TRAP-type C4-dicarboxylate transport system substrate-binding protein
MRLWPSVMQTTWSSIGVVPSNVAYAELYNALRSGSVGGFDSEPEWIVRNKFYEQAPNIALTSHEIVTRLILFSNQRFTKMPAPSRDALVACVNEAADFERNLEIRLDQETLNTLVQKHNVRTTNVNKDEFQKIASMAAVPLVQKYGLAAFVKEIEAARK